MKDLFWGYRLTPDGKVLDQDGIARPMYKDLAGYWKVSLSNPRTCEQKQYWIHRLLGLNYVENPCPGVFTVVDHIDQNNSNFELSNLRWLTHQLNCLKIFVAEIFGSAASNKRWKRNQKKNFQIV